MLVIGWDPGATVGWCRLEIGGDPVRGMTARWEACGAVRTEEFDSDEVASLCHGADLVAIEDIQHQYGGTHFKSAKAMIAAAKIGERIATIGREVAGKSVVQMTASRARTLIVGRNNPTDATVKIAVQRLVRGVPARTNAHERDAAVVALAVGWSKPRMGAA